VDWGSSEQKFEVINQRKEGEVLSKSRYEKKKK
jgi:hypothetical protein